MRTLAPSWHFIFAGPYGGSEVLVDGVTGAVIGGQRGPAFGAPKSHVGVTAADLKAAVSIHLFTQDKKRQWGKKPALELSRKRDNQVLSALAAASPWSGKTGAVLDAVRVEVKSAKKEASYLYYSPRLKIIGFPGSWVKAPESFQKIVGKLPKT